MNVLIAGARGFIGSRLAAALRDAGHTVSGGGRRDSASRAILPGWLDLDFVARRPGDWARAMAGIDVVINAVGILRERRGQKFDDLHTNGPQALFTAAQAAGVKRVIQISALGADEHATARYHHSKHQADRFLMQLPIEWIIVQPSLVYGTGGSSAALFETLASLPFILVPGDGSQRVQPVHVDDLIEALVRLVETKQARKVLHVVGPEELTLRIFLVSLRSALGLPRTWVLKIPRPLVWLAARAGNLVPGFLLDAETLAMLERGNTASAQPLTEVLGRAPRPVKEFIRGAEQHVFGAAAQFRWLEWLLRAGIGSMWLIAGIVSLGLYPVDSSLQLLLRVGVPVSVAPMLLTGAASLDIVLGVLTLWPRAPRWLWSAQIALVTIYTIIITLRLPALWLEPFGPVAKNLPILAMLILMRQLAMRR